MCLRVSFIRLWNFFASLKSLKKGVKSGVKSGSGSIIQGERIRRSRSAPKRHGSPTPFERKDRHPKPNFIFVWEVPYLSHDHIISSMWVRLLVFFVVFFAPESLTFEHFIKVWISLTGAPAGESVSWRSFWAFLLMYRFELLDREPRLVSQLTVERFVNKLIYLTGTRTGGRVSWRSPHVRRVTATTVPASGSQSAPLAMHFSTLLI